MPTKTLHIYASQTCKDVDLPYFEYPDGKDVFDKIDDLVKVKDEITTNQVVALIEVGDYLCYHPTGTAFDEIVLHRSDSSTLTFTYDSNSGEIIDTPKATEKALRPAHNLLRLYVAGKFNNRETGGNDAE